MNAMKIYNAELNDDASHPHVVAAREAGRDWARGQADACVGAPSGDWTSDALEALPLVSFPPDSEVEDQYERELELAEICNEAAAMEWDCLVTEYEKCEAEEEDEYWGSLLDEAEADDISDCNGKTIIVLARNPAGGHVAFLRQTDAGVEFCGGAGATYLIEGEPSLDEIREANLTETCDRCGSAGPLTEVCVDPLTSTVEWICDDCYEAGEGYGFPCEGRR